MFPKLTRVMFASGLGCFLAANSFVYLRDRNQQVQVNQRIDNPQIELSKNQERADSRATRQEEERRENSSEEEGSESMRRIREKVDGILEKNPSARENLASFFESLLGMDEEEDIRREGNEEKRR